MIKYQEDRLNDHSNFYEKQLSSMKEDLHIKTNEHNKLN